MKLERINLLFGIVLLIVFLITGWYMGSYFKPNNLENYVSRLQIRANHIYILYVSLLNIISFKTKVESNKARSNILNISIRVFLLLAGVFSLLAFVYEHTGDISKRVLTLITSILSLSATGLFLMNEILIWKKKK